MNAALSRSLAANDRATASVAIVRWLEIGNVDLQRQGLCCSRGRPKERGRTAILNLKLISMSFSCLLLRLASGLVS